MQYPEIARRLLEATRIPLGIGSRPANYVMSICDGLFRYRGGEDTRVKVGDSEFKLDLANPSERLLFYVPRNLLESYRNSPLFFLLKRMAAPSGVFVDIGANLGCYSLLARGLGYQTILFEPEPAHYAFLYRNAKQFGLPIGCALSDHSGTARFFVARAINPGSNSLVTSVGDPSGSEYDHEVTVDVKTFDSVLAEINADIASLRLIKIDVEGNEERTVYGMQNYLAFPNSAPIWCEVRGPSSGRCPNSVVPVTELLSKFGYSPFQYKDRAFTPYRVGYDPAPQVFDLLYAKPDVHGNVLDLGS